MVSFPFRRNQLALAIALALAEQLRQLDHPADGGGGGLQILHACRI